jgi:hypothetical protein
VQVHAALLAAVAAAAAPAGAPHITGVHLSNKTFAVGPAATPVSEAKKHKRVKFGTKLRVTLGAPGEITFRVQSRAHGRRVDGSCVPITKKNRHHPPCPRLHTLMTITRAGQEGRNTLNFSGRTESRTLKPGAYQFAVSAANDAGSSPERELRFRVVPAP